MLTTGTKVSRAQRRPGARRWLGFAGLLAIALAQVGCDLSAVDRLNHLHSDANQKAAEQALASFEKFSSDQTGLTPTLLKNLRTQAGHNRGLDDLRVAVDETDLTISLTGKTWDGLRTNLYEGLGVAEGEAGTGTDAFARWQRRLDLRTRARYRKVQAVGSVLRALGLGQEYLIVQAKENVKRSVDELERRQRAATRPSGANGRPADSSESATADELARADADRLVGALFEFRRAIIRAGNEAVTRATTRGQGLALQREILASVEQSRDKAMAYALVAVIGTGLSRDSTARLDAFLDRLATLLENYRPPTTGGPSGAAKAWDAFVRAADEARELVAATRGLDDLDQIKLGRADRAGGLPPVAGRVRAAVRKAGIEAGERATPDPAPGEPPDAAAAAYARDVEARLAVRFSTSTPEALIDALPEIGSDIGRHIEEFRTLIDKLPPSLVGEDLAELLDRVKSAGTSREALFNAGEEYLRKALASNPVLHRQIEEIRKDPEAKKRFDERVAHLGEILTDIDKESAAATNRVLEFLRDLYRLQLDLHEENLRHYRGLTGVAAAELKRWELLSFLNARYRRVFGDVWATLEAEDRPLQSRIQDLRRRAAALGGAAPRAPRSPEPELPPLPQQQRVAFSLFPKDAPASKQTWDVATARQGPGAAGQPALPDHPAISPDAPIIHSLRLLGETAHAWQFASPRRDPGGENARGSFHRLSSGIELINGQLLMISVNERFSLENGLVLRTEVQEHDLHLDAIAARTREAGMRLGLRDLVAYHTSGITNEDIQSVLGVIQQVLLANIGSKL